MDERRRKQMEYHQLLDAQVRERRMQEEMNKTQRRPNQVQPLPPMLPTKQAYGNPPNQPYPNSKMEPNLPQVPNTDNAELVRLSEEMRAEKGKYDSIIRSHQRDSDTISSLKDRIYALESATSDLRAGKEAAELRYRLVDEQRGDVVNNFRNELNELKHDISMEREARKQEAHRFMNEIEQVRNEATEKMRQAYDRQASIEEELRREKERYALLEERLMSRVSASEELLGKVGRTVNDHQMNGRLEAVEALVRKGREQHKQDVAEIAKSIATTRTKVESELIEYWKKVKSFTESKFLSERQQTEAKLLSLMNENEIKFNKKLNASQEEAMASSVSKCKDMIGRDSDRHSYEMSKMGNLFEDQVTELKRVLSAEIAARQGRTKQIEAQIRDIQSKQANRVAVEALTHSTEQTATSPQVSLKKVPSPSLSRTSPPPTIPETSLASFMGDGIPKSHESQRNSLRKLPSGVSSSDSFLQAFNDETSKELILEEVNQLIAKFAIDFTKKLDQKVQHAMEQVNIEQTNNLKALEDRSKKQLVDMKEEISTSLTPIKPKSVSPQPIKQEVSSPDGMQKHGYEEWTSAFDDMGTPYWYNNLTGESTYEEPNGWKEDLMKDNESLKERVSLLEEIRKQDKGKLDRLEQELESKLASLAKQAKDVKEKLAVLSGKKGTSVTNAGGKGGLENHGSAPMVQPADSDDIDILREEVAQCTKLSEKGLASLDQARLLILEQSLQIKSDKTSAQDIKNKENMKQLESLKKSFEIGLMKCSEELAKISSFAINEAKECSMKAEKSAQECEILIENHNKLKSKELEEIKRSVFDFSDSLNDMKTSLEGMLSNESNSLRALMRAMVGSESAERIRNEAQYLEDLDLKLQSQREQLQLEVQFASKEVFEKAEKLIKEKHMEQLLHLNKTIRKLEETNEEIVEDMNDVSDRQEVSECLYSMIHEICDRHNSQQSHDMYESIINIGYGALNGLSQIDIARQEAADYCDEEERERQEDVKFLAGKIHENEVKHELVAKRLEIETVNRERMKQSLFGEIKEYVHRSFKTYRNDMVELEQEIIDVEDRLNVRSSVETVLNGMVETVAFGVGMGRAGYESSRVGGVADDTRLKLQQQQLLQKYKSIHASISPKKASILTPLEPFISDRASTYESNFSSVPTSDRMESRRSLNSESPKSEESRLRQDIGPLAGGVEINPTMVVDRASLASLERISEVPASFEKSHSLESSERLLKKHIPNKYSKDSKLEEENICVVKMDLSSTLGVVINPGGTVGQVTPGEQGDLLGLEKGNRIIRVNQTPIGSAQEFKSSLFDHKQKGLEYVDLYFTANSSRFANLNNENKARSKSREGLRSVGIEHRYSAQGVIVNGDAPNHSTQDNIELFNKKKREIELANQENEKIRKKLEEDPNVGKAVINIKQPLGLVIGNNGEITEVNRGEQGAKVGLKVGMRVLRIHDKDVSSLEDIKFAMSKFKYFNMKEVDLYYTPAQKPGELKKLMGRLSAASSFFSKTSKSTRNSSVNKFGVSSPVVSSPSSTIEKMIVQAAAGNSLPHSRTSKQSSKESNGALSPIDRMLKDDETEQIRKELQKMSRSEKESASSKKHPVEIEGKLASSTKSNKETMEGSFDDKMMTIQYEDEGNFVDTPSPANIPPLSLSSRQSEETHMEYDYEDSATKVSLNLKAPMGLVINPKAIITKVFPGEQGEELGLRRGFKITKVGNCVVNSYQDIKIALESYKQAKESEVDLFYENIGSQKMGTFKRVKKADLAFNASGKRPSRVGLKTEGT